MKMKNNGKTPKMIVYSNVLWNKLKKIEKPSQKYIDYGISEFDELKLPTLDTIEIYESQKLPICLTDYSYVRRSKIEEYDIIVFDMCYTITEENALGIQGIMNDEQILETSKGKVFIILNYKSIKNTTFHVLLTEIQKKEKDELFFALKTLKDNYSLLKFIKIPLEDIATVNLGSESLIIKEHELKALKEYFQSAKAHKKILYITDEEKILKVDNKYPIKIIAKDIAGNIVSGAVRYGNNWIIYLPQSELQVKEKMHTLYMIGEYYYKYINNPEGILKKSSNKKVESQASFKTFPTPPNTEWKDVKIQVSENAMVTSVQEIKEVRKFHQIGFEDRRRRGYSNTQWKNLRKLAKNNGKLSWDSDDAEERMQKSIKSICERLKEYMGIKERPIYYNKKMGAYITRFNIELNSDLDREGKEAEVIKKEKLEDRKKQENQEELWRELKK